MKFLTLTVVFVSTWIKWRKLQEKYIPKPMRYSIHLNAEKVDSGIFMQQHLRSDIQTPLSSFCSFFIPSRLAKAVFFSFDCMRSLLWSINNVPFLILDNKIDWLSINILQALCLFSWKFYIVNNWNNRLMVLGFDCYTDTNKTMITGWQVSVINKYVPIIPCEPVQ